LDNQRSTAGQSLRSGERTIVVIAAVGIILALIKLAAPLFVPLIVAAFLAGALQPIVRHVQRLKLPHGFAVSAAVLFVVGMVFGSGALLALAGADISQTLGRFANDLGVARQELGMWIAQQGFPSVAASMAVGDTKSDLNGTLEDIIGAVPSVLSAASMAFLVALFVLLESTTFPDKLKRALDWQPRVVAEARGSVNEVQKYLLVKTALSLATGLLLGVWCGLWGLEGAVAFGMVAFVLNFIPYIGSLVAAIPPIVIALVQLGVGPAFGIAMGYVLVNIAIGNIIEPKVLGRALGLSPLVVLLSVFVWGWILGPVGALMGVLLTNVAKIVLAHSTDLSWIAVLLGPGKGHEERAYVDRKRRDSLGDRALRAGGSAGA
jgi:AI-2 transport protein TqsA